MKPPGGHLDDETFDDGFVKLKIDIFSVKKSGNTLRVDFILLSVQL